MTKRFYTQLPKSGQSCSFAVSDERGLRLCADEELPTPRDSVTVFLPGTEITSAVVKLAGSKLSQLAPAAAYAMEDSLAVPAEQIQVAISQEVADDGTRLVFAISQDVLAEWISQIDDAGLTHAKLVPDLVAVSSDIPLADLGDHMLVWIDGRAAAIDAAWPDDVRAALMKASPETIPNIASPLLFLAERFESTLGVQAPDFRHGVFARKKEQIIARSRLKFVAALAVSLSLLWLGDMAISTRNMNSLSHNMKLQSQRLFADAYPDLPVPGNLANASLPAANAPAATPIRFRDTASTLYSALIEMEGAQLTSVRFDADTRLLKATLNYGSFGDDAALKALIEARGARVDLGDTRLEYGRVIGDLTLWDGS